MMHHRTLKLFACNCSQLKLIARNFLNSFITATSVWLLIAHRLTMSSWPVYYRYYRKSRVACAQSFVPWHRATIEIMLAISLRVR